MNIENAITIDARNIPDGALLYETWQKMNSRVLSLTPINDIFDPSIDSGITANGFAGEHVAAWPSPKLFDSWQFDGGSERPAQPTRDEVRAAFMDWKNEDGGRYFNSRTLMADAVFLRFAAKSVASIPEEKLADCLKCLRLIQKYKLASLAEAKALLDEHVPVTDEPLSYNISRGEIEAGTDSGVTTITVRGDSGIKSSGSIYATTANVVVDQPVDHDMTPDRLITLNIRTQDFHHILAGLMNLMKIPPIGTGFVATEHGHSPSMTHPQIQALHDDLMIQADMKPQGRRVRNRGEMYLIEEIIEHAGGTIRHDGTVEWPVVKHHLGGGKRF